jgi:hypothetical protein
VSLVELRGVLDGVEFMALYEAEDVDDLRDAFECGELDDEIRAAREEQR